jgi:hypothetical protein
MVQTEFRKITKQHNRKSPELNFDISPHAVKKATHRDDRDQRDDSQAHQHGNHRNNVVVPGVGEKTRIGQHKLPQLTRHIVRQQTSAETIVKQAIRTSIARTLLEDMWDKPIVIQSYCAVVRLHGV